MPSKVRAEADCTKLTIIVPVYNERETIVTLLESLKNSPCEDCEWIIVDDGSNDGTTELLRQHVPESQTCLFKPANEGKTSAIKAGLERATREWVIIQDADLEYSPRDIPRLLVAAQGSKTEPVAVYGQRPGCWLSPSRWPFAIGVLLIDVWLLVLYGKWVRDHATCYKLLPRALLGELDLQSSGFEGCVEITAKLMRRGIPIVRIPIHYHPRSVQQGKKITPAYWFVAVLAAWRYSSWSKLEH